MKKHNFNAGPSELNESVVRNTAAAIENFAGTGLSLLTISHRSKEFVAVMENACNLVKELLEVPSGYSVLFLQGGASLQFSMVPFNFFEKKAGYLNTGVWAAKAMKEAKYFGEVVELASSKDRNYAYIPKGWEAKVPTDLDYVHITTNNTIYGTQLKADPIVNTWMAADMSSDILSRPVDISKYGVIYAGAQKNIGPSGATLVIVKDELLGKVTRPMPTMMDYKVHIENESMFNTPSTVSVFGCLQSLEWLKSIGGIKAIQKINTEKSKTLYGEIDSNRLFKGTVETAEDRSDMNVCFVMKEEYQALEDEFLKFAKSRGCEGLKGHRSVGGFRASIYNAVTIEDVQALTQAMKDFDKMK
jgi:phosphoserine aminotransferase